MSDIRSADPKCGHCGMVLKDWNEYHPYAACLMFKACGDGKVVRDNLAAVRAYRGDAK